MRRNGIIIALAVLVATVLLSAPALAATHLNPYEKQLVKLVNKQRAKHGLKALNVNVKLVRAARAHSADMGEKKYFSHDAPSGETWSARIIRHGYSREGYSFWKAGENIYYGAGLYSSPYVVAKAWMKSKPHRRVILTKVFRDLGIGAVKTDDGYENVDGAVWFFTLDVGRRIAQ